MSALAASTNEMVYALTAASVATAGAVHDLSSRRVPNRLTGGSLVCGLGLHLLLGGPRGLGSAAAAGLLGGSAFLVFYLAGGMGAGDVKLMAAVGCLTGWMPLPRVLLVTVICGAMMALGIALQQQRLRQTLANTWMLAGHHQQHGLRAHPMLHRAAPGALRMPYAVPIAVGCVVSMGLELWRRGW
jgi:prepilin peptidase CpaA